MTYFENLKAPGTDPDRCDNCGRDFCEHENGRCPEQNEEGSDHE